MRKTKGAQGAQGLEGNHGGKGWLVAEVNCHAPPTRTKAKPDERVSTQFKYNNKLSHPGQWEKQAQSVSRHKPTKSGAVWAGALR
jgi:hypothetical protein